MFEHVLPIILVYGILGFLVQPPVTEVGAYSGAHWTAVGDRHAMTRTAVGATAYSPLGSSEGDRFGIEFGAAYKQKGNIWYCGLFCEVLGDEVDDGRTLQGLLEVSVLGRARALAADGASLSLLLGPSWGAPMTCRNRNYTQGTNEKCTWTESDLRIVAGVGAAFRVSPDFGVSATLRYGLDPRELPAEEDGDPDLLDATLALGVVYRLGTAR